MQVREEKMGKKRKRRNKIERKGEVQWVRRWRSVEDDKIDGCECFEFTTQGQADLYNNIT